MPHEKEHPRPHGDPLQPVIDENPAQRNSDAAPDATAEQGRDELRGTSDRSEGQGSTANGVPAFDEDDGRLRRKQYDKGAGLVSGID